MTTGVLTATVNAYNDYINSRLVYDEAYEGLVITARKCVIDNHITVERLARLLQIEEANAHCLIDNGVFQEDLT